MTLKQLKRIGIVLVVVLGLWGLSTVVGGGGDTVEEMALIDAITSVEVDVVEFAGPEDTIRLEQQEPGNWTVNGFSAASDGISDLFTAIADAGTGELAAQNPSSHERMGVTEIAGKRLRVTRGGETLANVFIGRQGRGYRTVYVRRDGEDNVYVVESQLGSLAGRQVNDWRDKGILTIDTSVVSRIEVQRGRQRYTLARGDSTWTFADGAETDSSAVGRLLGEFVNLEAQGSGFPSPEQADSIDFSSPVRTVSLFDAQGNALAELLLDSTDANFWARHAGGETIFQLYQWKANSLTPVDSMMRRRD